MEAPQSGNQHITQTESPMSPQASAHIEPQGLKSTIRRVTDAQGIEHEIEFRQINHGFGVPTYGVVVDGTPVPRLCSGLYSKLLAFSDEQLAHHFFG